MILIGSRALALRAPQLLSRPPVDFDWICTFQEFTDWMEKQSSKVKPTKVYELPEFNKMIVEGQTNCEFEIIKPGTSSELLTKLVESDPDTLETSFGKIPSLDILFTIKDSHKFKKFEYNSSGFWKTALDWHKMKSIGAEIKPQFSEFHQLRQKETYKNVLPKLNMSKNDFFDEKNGINQIYDHDDIHKSIAIYDKPAYTYYLKDNSEVLTDKDKFFSISEEIRLAGVQEEACVLAIERSLVPFPGIKTSEQAFQFALAKVCTSITGGYFRDYAFLNVFKALKTYPRNYWDIFQEKVRAGMVRRLTK